MNQNIFLSKMYQQQSNDKYNPDVINKFQQLNNQNINLPYTNEYYKSITNEPIKNIKSAEDLKLPSDKPDLNKITKDYELAMQTRLHEQMLLNANNKKSTEDFNRINKVDVQESKDDYLDLKNKFKFYQIKEGDKLSEQKQKFNNLLNDLNKIL